MGQIDWPRDGHSARTLIAASYEQEHAGGQGRSGSGTMRVRAILLAAALMLAPLGVWAADLVVCCNQVEVSAGVQSRSVGL